MLSDPYLQSENTTGFQESLTSADPLQLCPVIGGHFQVPPEMFGQVRVLAGPLQDPLRLVPSVLTPNLQ